MELSVGHFGRNISRFPNPGKSSAIHFLDLRLVEPSDVVARPVWVCEMVVVAVAERAQKLRGMAAKMARNIPDKVIGQWAGRPQLSPPATIGPGTHQTHTSNVPFLHALAFVASFEILALPTSRPTTPRPAPSIG